MERYGQLIDLIREHKPETIIEVGTHKGERARLMCLEACKYAPVHYIGYDVFDTMDEEFHKEAFNAKGVATEEEARKRLDSVKQVQPLFTYEFIVGDTRDTLSTPRAADFVFIDGGHQADVINHDFKMLSQSGVIVFDDYYTDGPDIEKIGCNKVIADIPHTLLPVTDRVAGGGFVQMVVA